MAGCVPEVVTFGGGSVMVWEGICGQERTPLVIVKWITLCIRLSYHFSNIYQQGNARPHPARSVQNFL